MRRYDFSFKEDFNDFLQLHVYKKRKTYMIWSKAPQDDLSTMTWAKAPQDDLWTMNWAKAPQHDLWTMNWAKPPQYDLWASKPNMFSWVFCQITIYEFKDISWHFWIMANTEKA